MQPKDYRIQQMLAQYIEKTPRLLPIEPDNTDFIKKRLKIMRGMSKSFELSLQEIEALSDAEARKIASTYQSLMSSKNPEHLRKRRNSTDSFFLDQMPRNYPFTYDIVSSKEITVTHAQPPINGSGIKEDTPKPPSSPAHQVHGCPLKDDEVFSSSRYYSEDKTQYGRIIAAPGSFQIEHKNLNDGHKNDLVLETTFQFLLNMAPEKQNITISGNPQMAHKLNAAILYYQKEHSELFNQRFPNLQIHLPKDVELNPNQTQEDYIKMHLGALNSAPRQSEMLQAFLTQDKMQKNIEEMDALINLDKCINSPELNEQDKATLKTYQIALEEHLGDPDRDSLPNYIAQGKNFIEHTSKAMECINKSSSLEKEGRALKAFYDLTVTAHEELVKKSDELDKKYQAEMEPVQNELKKITLEMVQDGIHDTSSILKLWPPKDESNTEDLITCLKQLEQLDNNLKRLDPQSESDYHKIVIEFNRLLNESSRITNHSIPQFTKTQKSLDERIATFPNTLESEVLVQNETSQNSNTQTMKDTLSKLKSGSEDKIELSTEDNQELENMLVNVKELIKTDKGLKTNLSCKELIEALHQDIDLTKTKGCTIVKSIDSLLPAVQNNEALKKSLLEMRSKVTVLTSEKIQSPEEEQNYRYDKK